MLGIKAIYTPQTKAKKTGVPARLHGPGRLLTELLRSRSTVTPVYAGASPEAFCFTCALRVCWGQEANPSQHRLRRGRTYTMPYPEQSSWTPALRHTCVCPSSLPTVSGLWSQSPFRGLIECIESYPSGCMSTCQHCLVSLLLYPEQHLALVLVLLLFQRGERQE